MIFVYAKNLVPAKQAWRCGIFVGCYNG